MKVRVKEEGVEKERWAMKGGGRRRGKGGGWSRWVGREEEQQRQRVDGRMGEGAGETGETGTQGKKAGATGGRWEMGGRHSYAAVGQHLTKKDPRTSQATTTGGAENGARELGSTEYLPTAYTSTE